MFYHVIIETTEIDESTKLNKKYFEFDNTDTSEIIDSIIIPYLNKQTVHFKGYFLKPIEIKRIAINETTKSSYDLEKYENEKIPDDIIMCVMREDVVEFEQHAKNVSKNLFREATQKMNSHNSIPNCSQNYDCSRVFIVHGHDNLAKTEVARFVEKLGFEAIILHEQTKSGNTIIENIEEHSNVGYGIVIYTPCDSGAKKGEESKLKPRARQNVIFKHGYLIGKLSRKRVCALKKGEVDIPSDITGILYIDMDSKNAWETVVAKELKKAGYDVDLNKL